ncbi:MAG TPA: hypothetical protein ENI27_04555 [bacterium]|nr:hypothetical protein [bacterium]
MTNPFLAAELLRRDRSARFALSKDVRREEEEERRLEERRAKDIRKRSRRSSTARSIGRITGGIGGFLIGGPAGAAAGSYVGQRFGKALIESKGRFLTEKKRFDRISPGTYYVAGGERRERQFRADEEDRRRYLNELMLANAATDAITGYRAAKYGGGILDMLLGNTPAQRASDPSRNLEIFQQSTGY